MLVFLWRYNPPKPLMIKLNRIAAYPRIYWKKFTCTAAANSAANPIVCGASWDTINLPVFITDWKTYTYNIHVVNC